MKEKKWREGNGGVTKGERRCTKGGMWDGEQSE